jgi:hypothetical protein
LDVPSGSEIVNTKINNYDINNEKALTGGDLYIVSFY